MTYSNKIPVKNIALPASERKRLGAFYTPEILSRVLTDWAIQTSTDFVLEPSFGGCGFLASARIRLEELGCALPRKQIFGCDIDRGAFKFLAEALGQPVNTEQFRLEDFLKIKANGYWPQLFQATIGNPPYIPYQAIPAKQRKEYHERWKSLGIEIGMRASLWAHFLVHAVSFVALGGRMAWVLPGAFLQADYAKDIRKYLASNFGNILCVLMHERYFKQVGTEEETVVLLAKDRCKNQPDSQILFESASSIFDLSKAIKAWEAGEKTGRIFDARPAYFSVAQDVICLYNTIGSTKQCRPLGDFLNTKIGLVTGANKFFVLSKNECLRAGLSPAETVPILAKINAAPGLDFSDNDYKIYVEKDGRGHLVHTNSLPPQDTPLRAYLDTFPEEQRNTISTFKKRSVWHAPYDGNIPDAFFSVMSHNGPRLILNNANICCTNTIHRVFFKPGIENSTRKLIALSLLTCFSQLSAEFCGRRYGSGVLKHEPRDVEKISVLIPSVSEKEIDDLFDRTNSLLREGMVETALSNVDHFFLKNIEQSNAAITGMRASLDEARRLRRESRTVTAS